MNLGNLELYHCSILVSCKQLFGASITLLLYQEKPPGIYQPW